jgi:DNA-directed RNA polymerase specialized sigma subunit
MSVVYKAKSEQYDVEKSVNFLIMAVRLIRAKMIYYYYDDISYFKY